ncbi:uncharacterized protein SAPINGB_P005056 [Magnusiomyces paraingens]|uniref:DUF125-domain-containing protein n=1 Tax=Magnusiomyces paraingens TaxID=2606893 RepID=A0A5E8BY75_9ASCO|nr:uncharacterized protein SAPINGB_P005056 [Saprochaete ingens]VVT56434.1 unnamed protein product [Saprochaete ingens]
MVLVVLKNKIFGKPKMDKTSYLPTTHSYETVGCSDEEEFSESRSIISSTTAHEDSGFIPPRVMSDIIIGLSDGLTVPFALTAGLSSLGNSRLVITGGLAELVSGAISMGLGGYLAAKSESEIYHHEVEREKILYENCRNISEANLENILKEYHLKDSTIKMFISDMEDQPDEMIDFIIRFGKGLEEPAEGREFTSAMTIGLSYFFGGFVPLIPYFFIHSIDTSLMVSVVVMLVTLFIFGVLKTTFTLGWQCGNVRILSNGLQMVLTGSVAAGAAWGLVRLIE